MVALLNILGRQYRLRLGLVLEEVRPNRPSLPPVTLETTGEAVETPVSGPGLAKTRPALRLVRVA